MKLLVFDGNSIFNRAFYGVRPLTNSEGLHTNAIYGFLNIILKFIGEENPDEIAIAFDTREKTFRHELFDEYKAGRKGMPEELAEQIPALFEVVDALNITRLSLPGYEADDIIGSLCDAAQRRGVKSVIITGDRDSLQLISPLITVKLAVPKHGTTETAVYDEAAVMEKYKVTPGELLDVKALMGDQSDNIPGVAGIGEKTALSLITEYKTLENIYEKLAEKDMRPALKKKLEDGRQIAFMSRRLAEICKTVPLTLADGALKAKKPDRAALADILGRLEFSSFINRFELHDEEIQDRDEAPVNAVTPRSFSWLAEKIRAGGKMYIHCGDGVFFIVCGGVVYRVDENDEGCRGFILDTLADGGIKKYIHDAKPLALKLLGMGANLAGLAFDTRLAEYLLNPALPSHNLSDLCRRYLGKNLSQPETLAERLPSLSDAMATRIKEQGQEDLLYRIELPLCTVLASMEHLGFKVDKKALSDFQNELEENLSKVSERIYALAGHEFNINSPKQLSVVLFDELGLPPVQKTKTGYSTSAGVLERLLGFHEIIDFIMEHRQLAKLLSTYAQGLSKVAGPDGRIHTSFHQTITQTGRISSSEPNLQNIPVRYEMGRRLRRMFVPENKDFLLVDADYSQIELRVLAHLAGDHNMKNAFLHGEDIHLKTASEVFRVPFDKVTPEMRNSAKAVNFGIVYGISDFSLAQDIKVPRKEAKRYIEEYFTLYEGVRRYMDEIVRSALRDGFVTTMFGRRRYIPELAAQNRNTRAFGERIARNSPIQGTAADIIKIAMVRVHKRLGEGGFRSRLILQVHDELIVETHKDELSMVSDILKSEMEGAAALSVPLLAEVKSGASWYDAK